MVTNPEVKPSFEAAETGTPASSWRGSRAALPALDLGAMHRLVVLAAHPDDETLMAGGLIALAARRGVRVLVVVATTGAASHPVSPTHTPERLAALRADEVRHAVARLAPDADVELLDLPDGELAQHLEQVRDAVGSRLAAGDVVVAPWRHDRHPDHDALGGLAAELTTAARVVLLEAPIWAWHWGDPLSTAMPGAVRVGLDAAGLAAELAAIGDHRTQVEALSDRPGDEALLLPGVLRHFQGPDEVFLYSAAAPPVDFDAMYQESDDPWGFADRWYERRKRAITIAALPAPRYARALEIGSSIGFLAADLATRVDELLATDVAARAVELATARLAAHPHARVELRRLPAEWPDGSFDLIVLSETGFYLRGDALVELVARAHGALNPGGVLLACHWRPQVVGLDRDGDAVHRVIRDRFGDPSVQHVEEDFRLELFPVPPSASVARTTGLR